MNFAALNAFIESTVLDFDLAIHPLRCRILITTTIIKYMYVHNTAFKQPDARGWLPERALALCVFIRAWCELHVQIVYVKCWINACLHNA